MRSTNRPTFPDWQRLGRLTADARGVSTIEFALLLPLLGFFLLGTIDVTRGVIARYTVEQAAQATIEQVSTGNRSRSDYSFLAVRGATAATVPIGQVTVTQWLECRPATGAPRGPLAMSATCNAGETEARYVKVRIWKRYMPVFGYNPFGSGFAGRQADGSFRVFGEAGVRVQ